MVLLITVVITVTSRRWKSGLFTLVLIASIHLAAWPLRIGFAIHRAQFENAIDEERSAPFRIGPYRIVDVVNYPEEDWPNGTHLHLGRLGMAGRAFVRGKPNQSSVDNPKGRIENPYGTVDSIWSSEITLTDDWAFVTKIPVEF